MTIGSILLGLALLILVALFVARPFLQRQTSANVPKTSRQHLLAQKEAILTEIQSLDFDYETGKVPAEIYEPQRAEMVAEAAVVLQQLDALPPIETVDDEIEAAIAQLRQQIPARQPAVVTTPKGNGHGRYCTQCGSLLDPGDKFCAHCGAKVAAPAAHPAQASGV